MQNFTPAQLSVVAAFSAFVRSRFDSLTVNILDRSESYWHEMGAKWALEFGKTEECAKLCEGMTLPQIARTLTQLPQIGFAVIAERMSTGAGWSE